MPVFYLNVMDGPAVLKAEGENFSDLESARRAAVEGAREIMMESLWNGAGLGLHRRIQICNGRRKPVDELLFEDALMPD